MKAEDAAGGTTITCTYPDAPVYSRRSRKLESIFKEVLGSNLRGSKSEVDNKIGLDSEAAQIAHYTGSKRGRSPLGQDNRRLGSGTCKYSDVCCQNSAGDCVLMGHPPHGHSDVVMDHCPTTAEGASGVFSTMVDEKGGRANSCCKSKAAAVDWTYTDGTSTGADIDGNTGCQSDNTCTYPDEECCYNTFGDHKVSEQRKEVPNPLRRQGKS